MAFKTDTRLDGLDYDAQNFSDLRKAGGEEIWEFLKREDNVIRMETATLLDRPAVEPLGPFLLREFGENVNQDRYRQMIGHMARQIMEAIDYELDRPSLRVTRLNMFTTAAAYKPKGDDRDRGMKITREQRDAWAAKTAKSDFNVWVDSLVKTADGGLNLDALYSLARKYGIEKEYRHLNPGQQRMNIGVQLRPKVSRKEYQRAPSA